MVEDIEREAAILRFSAVLTEAQAMAVEAEQEVEGKQQWGPYMKNSACTKCLCSKAKETCRDWTHIHQSVLHEKGQGNKLTTAFASTFKHKQ